MKFRRGFCSIGRIGDIENQIRPFGIAKQCQMCDFCFEEEIVVVSIGLLMMRNRCIEIGMMLLALLLCVGCEYFEYHPYDTDIQGERGLTAIHVLRIERALRGRSSFRFAVISDTQGWYDETEQVVEALNARQDLDFVIHCGDISDFGLKREFQIQRDILSELHVPFVALIGNHDCLATGEVVYREIFGPTNFAFTAADTRIICLNTNAMEYDYATPIPDFAFMESELTSLDPMVRRVLFVMHVRPGEFQFNNNVSEIFQRYIRSAPGDPFCIYGHEHTLRHDDLFGDGVIYYQCPNIEKRCYLLFTLNESGYTYEAVYF